MNPLTTIGIGLAFLTLAGCATRPAEDPRYARSDGWRPGRVAEVGAAGDIRRRSFRDCRVSSSEGSDGLLFASIWYRRTGGRMVRIAKLDPALDLHVGDLVYVNIESCAQPPEKRAG